MTTPLAPDSNLLQLGKGQILFARFSNAGVRGNYFHLGNCEQFEIAIEADVLDKYSSMSRGTPLYKRVVRRQDTSLRIQMEEWSKENLALFLMGTVETYSQAATPVVDEVLTTSAVLGGYYKLANLGPYTALTVQEATPTPLVEGVDFRIVDPIVGIIQLLPGATAVADGETVEASYTPTAYTAATARSAIAGGTQSLIEGSLLFIPDPQSGQRWGCEVWRTSSTPDGALGMISEEFGTFSVQMGVQDDTVGTYGGSATFPLYRMVHYPAAA